MGKRYFGTDGIRGIANGPKMTPELAMKVGQAAGTHFLRGGHMKSYDNETDRISGHTIDDENISEIFPTLDRD